MIDTETFDPLAYVTAAAPAVGLRLTEAHLAELAEAFALVVRIGGPAFAMAVPADVEPAPVFVA
jgi:glycine cleavage system regulatory protein